MAQKDWDEFAGELTVHVRRHWQSLHRGAVLMPCIDEAATFALVFANNEGAAPEAVHQEVDLIRQRVRDEDMEDLGFGLSDDGCTWTLVIRIQTQLCQTEVGRVLQRELLKIRLEEAVQKAWAAVNANDSPELAQTA